MASVPHDHVSSITERAPLSRQPTSSSLDHVAVSKSDAPIRVAVVGGGMGGLAVAIGLLKFHHIDVQIYEAASKFAEIGAGVAFGPNAQKALAMIGPHVEQAYLNQATHNGWDIHKKEWFEFRIGEGSGEGTVIAALENETGQSTVHRARFLEEFVGLVPQERAHFGKRLVKLEDPTEEGGPIVLHFKDGTSAEADAVIGADGVHSATRTYLLGEDHPAHSPQFTGTVAYRGLIPMQKAIDSVGAELAQNAHIICGHKGFLQMYPVNFGDTISTVVVTYKHKTWEHKDWVVESDAAHLQEDFEGWGSHVTKLLGLLERPNAWSMWDHPPAPYFNKGRVCMMGDAAHASTPYQGQGAGQAFEDALVLVTLLGRVKEIHEVEHAFAAYDSVRRPRSQKNVKTSRESGLALSFQNPEIGDDREKLAENLKTRMHWLWNQDLGEQNDEAIAHMDSLLSKSS